MGPSTSTRRAFIGTGLAAAGAAGSVVLFRRGRLPAPSTAMGIAVAPGSSSAMAVASPGVVAGEMAIWARSIGQSFTTRGVEGTGGLTLTAVSPIAVRGARPAGIRQQPFWVYFSYPAALAPKGDAIYAIDHPVAGLAALFLTRAPDRDGRAVLMALFD